MPDDLETLCSWEIEILPQGSKDVMDDICSLLKKIGFKKDKDWTNGSFSISPVFSKGIPYDILKVYFMAENIINTPLIVVIDHEVRKHEEYIRSVKFEKNEKYLGKK